MTDLEYHAARWLKWEKRCQLVMTERSPRCWFAGEPDVIGVNPSRFIFEIEVKRSMSDFRANQNKRHMQNRFSNDPETAARYTAKAPKQFWFLVPPKLVQKVEPELPDFAGLMTLHGSQIQVIRKSPVNNKSEKLTLMECAKLMQCAGNMIISMMAYRRADRSGDPHAMDEFYANDLPRYDKQPFEYLNFQI